MTISWALPLEPNGIIIAYEVAVEGSSSPRDRREADVTVDGRSTRNVSNTTTSVTITNLSEWGRVGGCGCGCGCGCGQSLNVNACILSGILAECHLCMHACASA